MFNFPEGQCTDKVQVLTNSPCSAKDCAIPLLRSPAGQSPAVHFCVNCDENKTGMSVVTI